MKAKRSNGIKFIVIIMAFIMVYFAYTIYNQISEINRLEAKIDERAQVLEEVEREIAKLEKEIENSESLSFVEKVARDEYGMVKPKEVIFIDKDKEDSTKTFGNN